MKRKSKIFRKRDHSNRNPVAEKLASGQFKPRLIKDKKKEGAREEARNVPYDPDWFD